MLADSQTTRERGESSRFPGRSSDDEKDSYHWLAETENLTNQALPVLATQPQSFDHTQVLITVRALKILEKTGSFSYEDKKTATTRVIFLHRTQMIRDVTNSLCRIAT